jgi:hypothetical protein
MEAIMKHEPGNGALPTAGGGSAPALPAVVDRATWQAQLDGLLVREKAHTREGDAIAAARRRLPMVEVDPAIPLIGEHGPVPLLEVFEGRRQLIVYFHMWHTGQPAQGQCEGCTFFNGQVRELSYLHSRDVTYATFCPGPYDESIAYRDFMGGCAPVLGERLRQRAARRTLVRHAGVLPAPGRAGVRDLLEQRPRRGGAGPHVRAARHGGVRPPGDLGGLSSRLAQPFGTRGEQFRTNGRPTAQWSRLAAGRSDDLGTASTVPTGNRDSCTT